MKNLLIPVLAVLLAGCSHASSARIYEGKEGAYISKANETEKAKALDEAADGAKDFCKDSGKKPIFLKDETLYTGTMDEKTRDVVKKAGEILGGPVKVYGSKTTGEKDYVAELSFKCM